MNIYIYIYIFIYINNYIFIYKIACKLVKKKFTFQATVRMSHAFIQAHENIKTLETAEAEASSRWSGCAGSAGSGRRTAGSSSWWGSCACSWGSVWGWGSHWNTSSPWRCWWWPSGRCWPGPPLGSPAIIKNTYSKPLNSLKSTLWVKEKVP